MSIEHYFVTGMFFAWHNYLFDNNAHVQICPFTESWQYKRGDVERYGRYTPLFNSYKVDDDAPNELKIALEDLHINKL